MYSFYIDVYRKPMVYTVLWDGLWSKLWDMAVKGKMWHVIKSMYEASRSAVLLDGEKSSVFSVKQGVVERSRKGWNIVCRRFCRG